MRRGIETFDALLFCRVNEEEELINRRESVLIIGIKRRRKNM